MEVLKTAVLLSLAAHASGLAVGDSFEASIEATVPSVDAPVPSAQRFDVNLFSTGLGGNVTCEQTCNGHNLTLSADASQDGFDVECWGKFEQTCTLPGEHSKHASTHAVCSGALFATTKGMSAGGYFSSCQGGLRWMKKVVSRSSAVVAPLYERLRQDLAAVHGAPEMAAAADVMHHNASYAFVQGVACAGEMTTIAAPDHAPTKMLVKCSHRTGRFQAFKPFDNAPDTAADAALSAALEETSSFADRSMHDAERGALSEFFTPHCPFAGTHGVPRHHGAGPNHDGMHHLDEGGFAAAADLLFESARASFEQLRDLAGRKALVPAATAQRSGARPDSDAGNANESDSDDKSGAVGGAPHCEVTCCGEPLKLHGWWPCHGELEVKCNGETHGTCWDFDDKCDGWSLPRMGICHGLHTAYGESAGDSFTAESYEVTNGLHVAKPVHKHGWKGMAQFDKGLLTIRVGWDSKNSTAVADAGDNAQGQLDAAVETA